MAGHVFLDGLALGVAFSIDEKLGLAVFVALLVHAFSDGLNTVSLLIKSGKWSRKGVWLLVVDSFARISGAVIGSTLALNANFTAHYLAAFAGILIYLATSHILPEAHARHASRWTLVATISGVVIMWALVSQLHAGHSHGHDHNESSIEQGVEHDNSQEDHSDEDHSSETHDEDHQDDHDHDHNE